MRKNRGSQTLRAWIILVALFSIVFLFRKTIVLTSVKLLLAFTLSGKHSSFTYEKIAWEDACIRLDEISFANSDVEMTIDQVNFSFSIWPLASEIKVFRPHVFVKHGGVSTSLPWLHLFSSRLTSLTWEVNDGILNYEGHDPLYFRFLSDKEKVDTLGRIWLSYEPQESAPALLDMQLKRSSRCFELQFSLREEDLSQSPLRFSKVLPELTGKVAMQGTLVFYEKSVHEATLDIQGALERKGTPYAFALQAVGERREGAFLLKLHLEEPQEIHADFTFTRQGHLLEIKGESQIEGQACTGAATFDCPTSHLTALLWKKNRSVRLESGWFTFEKLQEKSYKHFLELFFPDVHVKGSVSCRGNFDASYVALSLEAQQCVAQYDSLKLSLPSTLAPLQLVYAIKEKKWEGSIPLQGASLTHLKSGFTLQKVDADLHLTSRTLSAPSFSALVAGCSVKGAFDTLKIDGSSLLIEKAKVCSLLPSGTPLEWHIPQLTLFDQDRLAADFHVQLLEEDQTFVQWVGSVREYGEKKWEFLFDPKQTRCLNTPLNISMLKVEQGKIASLDMQPLIDTAEIAQCWKHLRKHNSLTLPDQPPACNGMVELKLSYQPQSPLHLSLQADAFSFEGKKISPFTLRGQVKERFLEIEQWQANTLKGKGRLCLNGCLLTFDSAEAIGPEMTLKGKGSLDLCSRELLLHFDNVESALPPFSALAGTVHAQGSVKANLAKGVAEGEGICTFVLTAPFNVTAWNTKPFKLSFSKESGYTLSDGHLYLRSKGANTVLGSLLLPHLCISQNVDEVKISGCQFSLKPALLQLWKVPTLLEKVEWPETIDSVLDVQKKGKEWMCRGRLKEGKYGLMGHKLDLSQLGFNYEKGLLKCFTKTQVGVKTLFATLCSTCEEPQGYFSLSDSSELSGMRFSFKTGKEGLEWEKVQGSCLGITADLHAKEAKKIPGARTFLSGQLAMDFSELKGLFPKESIERFKVGKGYQWQGDLILWKDPKRLFQMKGEIRAKDFELCGYRFARLFAGCDMHPDLILLSQVELEDDAGTLQIKKIELAKKENWELSIPLISIREWHPSSMKSLDTESKGDKPFLIRNFTLSGIQGILGKKESLQGRARLTFTNAVKKESSLLDTPLEIIKNFGLDSGLLTPIQGELEFDLHGDRLYLTTLKDTFSEGKRSEFYLAPGRSPSYIDLDGKMHIDLKMRQEVMLKVTEAFVLTIRGTLDNPRYGLQFR